MYRKKECAHGADLRLLIRNDPIPLQRRYRDVFFADVPRPNRVEFLCDLIPRLDGLKFQFLLPCPAHFRKPKLPIPECEWNIRMSPADRLLAARFSKVVLYLERNSDPCGEPGRRLFEVAALGVAQVALSDAATIGPYFEPGREILLAKSAQEAAGLIRELLADPTRLEAIGRAARERVLAEHIYFRRTGAVANHRPEQLCDRRGEEYGLPGGAYPAALESDDLVIFSAAPAGNAPRRWQVAVKTTLNKVHWIFKTQGAHGVVRRAWQRAASWIHTD